MRRVEKLCWYDKLSFAVWKVKEIKEVICTCHKMYYGLFFWNANFFCFPHDVLPIITCMTSLLIILWLILFEVVSSIDNAVINAQVLGTVSPRAKKWFLFWGMIFAVFLVRGFLPWAIIWATNPSLGPWEAFMASFSGDPHVHESIESSAPVLLMGGGIFLLFLFFHWLFMEEKYYSFWFEKWFHKHDIWFFAVVSVILAWIVWEANHLDSMIAFSAVVGSSAFFIAHGFKENAEKKEHELTSWGKMTDLSKILYLEIIDMTFSIDGVLGAFAFTLSVPLILIGNGIGAFVVRELTLHNIERVKKYIYLKNGAMYSIGLDRKSTRLNSSH